MSSNGPIGCLVSRPLAAGCTGRLSVSVWLRVADARAQPPLRLALEGKLAGRDYYRFAPVGLAPDGAQAAVPITTNWAPYVFQVNDLPLEGLSQLRVRFDLMGAGEVWLDDVQLFDLAFSENEHTELLKLIALARVTLHNGQVGDCVRLLDGYWPRFLEEKVAVQPGTTGAGILANKPGKSPPPAPRPPDNPPHTGLLDRMKGLLPEQLR